MKPPDIVQRLRGYTEDDHARGCQGRCYACTCGYDDKRDPLMVEAAEEIEQLRRWLFESGEEVQSWRDRFEAEKQDHEATLKAWEEERSS